MTRRGRPAGAKTSIDSATGMSRAWVSRLDEVHLDLDGNFVFPPDSDTIGWDAIARAAGYRNTKKFRARYRADPRLHHHVVAGQPVTHANSAAAFGEWAQTEGKTARKAHLRRGGGRPPETLEADPPDARGTVWKRSK